MTPTMDAANPPARSPGPGGRGRRVKAAVLAASVRHFVSGTVSDTVECSRNFL